MSGWTLVAAAWLGMALVMAGLWAVQRRTRNAGIVDVAWALGTGLTAVWFAWGAGGDPVRRVLVGGMAGLWGLRLGAYLWRRVTGEPEDGRYRELRERWGERVQPYLFVFFQLQATWAVLFALPMWIAARNPASPGWSDAAGVAVWLVALAGETLADRQLARFRSDPDSAGRVCREGFWRYSRHPNYFFEWIHWWAYPLLAFPGPGWAWTLLGPLVMLAFLFRITGIPPTEARALRSRGEAYREYRRTTSAFFPWPPSEPEER